MTPKQKNFSEEKRTINIALAGNPNVGKSVIFNQLTGLSQTIGNWPGKTVERMEGYYYHKCYRCYKFRAKSIFYFSIVRIKSTDDSSYKSDGYITKEEH